MRGPERSWGVLGKAAMKKTKGRRKTPGKGLLKTDTGTYKVSFARGGERSSREDPSGSQRQEGKAKRHCRCHHTKLHRSEGSRPKKGVIEGGRGQKDATALFQP